jgi:hypothetical protein
MHDEDLYPDVADFIIYMAVDIDEFMRTARAHRVLSLRGSFEL